MNRPLPIASLWVAACLALPWSGTHATTLLPMDAGQLADRAELIFVGTALHSDVVPSGDGRFPFTFVTFDVEDTLKGRTEGPHLTLRFHGGVLADRAVLVDGMPRFTVGERYLLFVRANGEAHSPVLGWTQGQLRFAREARSGRAILIDFTGRPLLGVAGAHWVRGEPGTVAGQEGRVSPRAVILDQEGVTVRPLRPASGAEIRRIPGAGEIVRTLRALVRDRSAGPAFQPGRLVRSADPADVPTSVVFGSPSPSGTPSR